EGLYRVEQGGLAYLYTQMEPMNARKAFPCWDEPEFKVPFQITIEVPRTNVAISNAPIQSERTNDNWKTVVFEKTDPMPSYLLAVMVGPFETIPINGLTVPGRIVTVRGKSHLAGLAAEVTPPILKALERYFSGRYPYKKLDVIAVPEFLWGAMENPGAVTF